MSDIESELAIAREQALLNNYETSLMYYNNVMQLANQYGGTSFPFIQRKKKKPNGHFGLLLLLSSSSSSSCCCCCILYRRIKFVTDETQRDTWVHTKECIDEELQIVKKIVTELSMIRVNPLPSPPRIPPESPRISLFYYGHCCISISIGRINGGEGFTNKQTNNTELFYPFVRFPRCLLLLPRPSGPPPSPLADL